MKYILIYIKLLWKETVYIATGIFGLILASIVPIFISNSRYSTLIIGSLILVISMILANFQVIIKLYKAKQELEEEVRDLKKNTIDYLVNVEVKEINIIAKENVLEEIDWAKSQILQYEKESQATYSGWVSNLIFTPGGIENAKKELNDYKKEMEEIVNVIKNLENFKIFNLDINLNNNSDQYDEKIKVYITVNNGYFADLFDSKIYDLRNIPKRPELNVINFLSSLQNSISIPGYQEPKNIHIVNSSQIILNCPELHAKKDIDYSNDTIFLIYPRHEKITFEILVYSKNAKEPIKISKQI